MCRVTGWVIPGILALAPSARGDDRGLDGHWQPAGKSQFADPLVIKDGRFMYRFNVNGLMIDATRPGRGFELAEANGKRYVVFTDLRMKDDLTVPVNYTGLPERVPYALDGDVLTLSVRGKDFRFERRPDPWFGPELAWVPGTGLGCLFGLWGGTAGWLSPRKRARGLVLGSLALLAAASAAMLVLGIVAHLGDQPRDVWYGLGFPGLLCLVLSAVLMPVMAKRYAGARPTPPAPSGGT